MPKNAQTTAQLHNRVNLYFTEIASKVISESRHKEIVFTKLHDKGHGEREREE